MKRILLSLLVLGAGITLSAQTSAKPKPVVKKPETAKPTVVSKDDVSKIKFNKTTHDFGTIPQGIPVTYTFTFVNNNSVPITIDQASASCGCTTPKKPDGAIAPGATGTIEVGFNAAAVGVFDKTITLNTSMGVIYLKITGVVEQIPLEAAPQGLD